MIGTEASELESLKRENTELRQKLARVSTEVELYRADAYRRELDTQVPPTDQEIEDLLASPHEQGLMKIIEEFEARIPR